MTICNGKVDFFIFCASTNTKILGINFLFAYSSGYGSCQKLRKCMSRPTVEKLCRKKTVASFFLNPMYKLMPSVLAYKMIFCGFRLADNTFHKMVRPTAFYE